MQKNIFKRGLIVVLFLLVFVISFASAEEKKYPPYPDVWDREYMAQSKAEAYGEIPNLLKLSNGDVLYLFYERVPIKDRKDDYDLISHQATFFGGQTVINAKSNLRILRGQQTELELSDGTMVSVIKEKGNSLSGRLKLSNGLEVVSVGSYSAHGKCDHGPIDYYFYAHDKEKGEYGTDKVIFILLDKPKQRMWDQPRPLPESNVEVDPCTEEGPPGYTTRVEAVWGGKMLPLDDGTFLLPMGNGLIVRFDANFRTKSLLINRRFFVFDLNDSNLFIDKINGKKYNLEKTGYQPIYDDLYKYLDDIRRKQP